MPINQPVRPIIHTSDFCNKAYSFDVESVLTAQERIGVLAISASAGYLLATSSNKAFRREQVIKHTLQEDGSWIAKDSITVILAADSPVDGTVLIRNSAGETFVVTLDVTSTTSPALLPQSTLIISESALSFSQTAPDKPSFAILTIAQQHSKEPVTLTTDAPDYFQLASDSRPAFLPTLTVMPSPIGVYVHVRYSASKSGFHAGQLTIQNSLEKRTVVLEGRSSGLLANIRAYPIVSGPVKSSSLSEHLPRARRWVGALSIVVMSGLAYAGYANRCQLFPTLCRAPEAGLPSVQEVRALPTLAHENTTPEKIAVNSSVSGQTKRKHAPAPVPNLSSPPDAPSEPISPKQVVAVATDQERRDEAETSESSGQQQPKRQSTRKLTNRQPVEQITPPASTDESELERTLNQKPNPL